MSDYSSTYSNVKGAYSVRKLFDSYTGPQLKIRRSSDNLVQDFYFNKNGVSAEYEAWIGGSTATIVKWYDQSGKGNHGTSVNGNITLDYVNKCLFFDTTGYFTLPDGTVPYNNDPYTMIVYHGDAPNYSVLIGSGSFADDNMANYLFLGYRWWYLPLFKLLGKRMAQ